MHRIGRQKLASWNLTVLSCEYSAAQVHQQCMRKDGHLNDSLLEFGNAGPCCGKNHCAVAESIEPARLPGWRTKNLEHDSYFLRL